MNGPDRSIDASWKDDPYLAAGSLGDEYPAHGIDGQPLRIIEGGFKPFAIDRQSNSGSSDRRYFVEVTHPPDPVVARIGDIKTSVRAWRDAARGIECRE